MSLTLLASFNSITFHFFTFHLLYVFYYYWNWARPTPFITFLYTLICVKIEKEDERAVMPLFVGVYKLNTHDVLGNASRSQQRNGSWWLMVDWEFGWLQKCLSNG